MRFSKRVAPNTNRLTFASNNLEYKLLSKWSKIARYIEFENF